MKRVLMAAAAFVALAVGAPRAQAVGGGGGGGRMRMAEMLFKDITLTDAQKVKTDSVIAHYREMMGPMGGGMGSPPDSATMAKRREIMSKEQADLRALLNADQVATFDKNLAAMRERMAQRRPPGS